jgi:ribosomal protein S18 acetylase RimI-like enzyme
MALSTSTSRLIAYYQRYGFGATLRRAGLAIRRALFSNGMIVFCCDLAKQSTAPPDMPSSLTVRRLSHYTELSPEDLQELIGLWNPKQAHRNIGERFERGASLWLIRSGERLGGYSWTLRGRTIAEYYFPMAQDDVQLFDFYVFPRFRGRAILWFLIIFVLSSLREEGASRVFGDVAEWNQPSLSFYKTIPFQRLGRARTFTILGHTFVSWTENEPSEKTQKDTLTNASMVAGSTKDAPVPGLRI